jgi:hypothetical protein
MKLTTHLNLLSGLEVIEILPQLLPVNFLGLVLEHGEFFLSFSVDTCTKFQPNPFIFSEVKYSDGRT